MSERTKTYFISDIHLGARYITDPRRHEAIVVAILEQMRRDAKAVYFLGDILDYWFEYRTVVPRGYVRFFGALARLVDAGVKVTWIIGNHDIWLFDYIRDEIGVEVFDGNLIREIDGKRFFLSHGDGLGSLKPGFRFIRAMFRNRLCQILYAGIHPRWTVPFAHRWSSGSRAKGEEQYSEWRGDDVEPSMIFAQKYLVETDPDINYFITGHRHIFVDKKIASDTTFVVLGDFYKQFVYAEFDGVTLLTKHFDADAVEINTF